MRKTFSEEVYKKMAKNPNIYVISGDLGYGVWDKVRDTYPTKFINTGAAEQAMMGIGVGMALEGKIPLVYSITSFLLFRPFETIRNYVNYERIPVKMVGSGRDKDYRHDGISHWAEEDKLIMKKIFKNIVCAWPEEKEDIEWVVDNMLKNKKPYYINLPR